MFRAAGKSQPSPLKGLGPEDEPQIEQLGYEKLSNQSETLLLARSMMEGVKWPIREKVKANLPILPRPQIADALDGLIFKTLPFFRCCVNSHRQKRPKHARTTPIESPSTTEAMN
jgi:hypothetical protein